MTTQSGVSLTGEFCGMAHGCDHLLVTKFHTGFFVFVDLQVAADQIFRELSYNERLEDPLHVHREQAPQNASVDCASSPEYTR
jgi:hypothetical protein